MSSWCACVWQAMFQAGKARWGTDESVFNRILCSQSFPQLRAVFDEYQKVSGSSVEQSIDGELSGNLRLGMHAIGTHVVIDSSHIAIWKQCTVYVIEKFSVVCSCRGEKQGQLLCHTSASQHEGEWRFCWMFEVSVNCWICCIVCVVITRRAWCPQGAGTDDRSLVRIMVTRCEVDMVQIKQEFQKLYGKTLESFIQVNFAYFVVS